MSAALAKGLEEEEEEEEEDGGPVSPEEGEPLDGLLSKEFLRGLLHCFTGTSDGESYWPRDP
jgi:hypothetical protein